MPNEVINVASRIETKVSPLSVPHNMHAHVIFYPFTWCRFETLVQDPLEIVDERLGVLSVCYEHVVRVHDYDY